jgi:O-antigen/teichoic acid export membrane protein
VFSVASFGSIGIVTLFTSILSARLYGITIVGQAALVMAPIPIVALLSTVREQPAMVRELAKLSPRHPRVTGVFLAVFAFSFALTALATALGVVICYLAFRGPLHHPDLFAPAVVCLCGYLLIINTCWNADSVFGAFRAGRELFVVRLHQAVMYGAFLSVLALTTRSVWGLLLAFLASWLTSLVHRMWLLRRVMSWRTPMSELRAGFRTLREIIAFGLKLTPGSLAAGFTDAGGTWIVGVTSTVSAVGAYSRAWNLASRLTELNWRITEMLLPTLIQRRDAGDSEGFDRVLVDSLRYAAFGLLLPAAVGGGAAEAIMHVFGAGFEMGAAALRWLLLVPLLLTMMAIQGTALMASNRPLVTSVVQIVRLVATLAGGVVLTLALGVTGMALAVTGAAAATLVLYFLLPSVRLRAPTVSQAHVRQFAGLGAAYASGFLVSHLLEQQAPGGLGLGLALIAGSFAYVVVGVWASGTSERDRERLRGAIGWLSARRASALDGLGLT